MEPTGNLDPETAVVREHLLRFHRAGGTVVVVTHGSDLTQVAQRTIELTTGRLAAQSSATPSPA